jgi:DNA integrity scanning protein DisA with diadenylate cyclase activity
MLPKKSPEGNPESNETREPNIIELFEQYYKSQLELVSSLQKAIEQNLKTQQMYQRHLAEINKPHVVPEDEDYTEIARIIDQVTEKKPKQLLELREMLNQANSELAEMVKKLDDLKEPKKPELIN